MDPIAWLMFGGALAATIGSFVATRRASNRLAVGLLVCSALLLRADLALHWWLSPWDERYHALVARNLIDHPLEPTLVDQPLHDVPPSQWTESRVWLHKPPLALWLMAGSMAVFGENEVALRVPSVLLASLAVALTFVIARRLFGTQAGWIAATAHAWHGRSAILSAGLRASDHVDTVLIFLVELGVLLGMLGAPKLARRERAGWPLALGVGLATGLAHLTKAAPALLVLVVFAALMIQWARSWRLRLLALAAASVTAAGIALPWLVYTATSFPEAFEYALSISWQRFLGPVEGHLAPWYFHFTNIPKYFGTLTWIPVIAFVIYVLRQRREAAPLLIWFAVTYATFSLAGTKMESYVFIASPVIFCALGWFGAWCLDARGRIAARTRWVYAVAFLLVATAYVAAGALKAHRPWKRPARHQLWTHELRYLGSAVDRLPGGPWLVFNAPADIEAMFYVRATFTRSMPTPDALEEAASLGFRTAVYGSPDEPRLAPLRGRIGVVFLGYDPRTLAARRILTEVRGRKLEDPLILNAREAVGLEEYLDRFIRCDVLGQVAVSDSELTRARRKGRPLIILVQPGNRAPRGLQSISDAVLLFDPSYAIGAPADG